jgi:hypothetical protein
MVSLNYQLNLTQTKDKIKFVFNYMSLFKFYKMNLL